MSSAIRPRLVLACKIPKTMKNMPTADKIAPKGSKGRVGSGSTGSSSRRLRKTIVATTRAWKTNAARQLIPVVMRPPIEWSRCGADPCHATDHAERTSARGQVAERHRRKDVDGRNQEGRAHALEDGVAEDQHAEARGDGAQKRANPVEDETSDKAPLATPTIRQLAGRDHQDGHDQQEQRDRGLHALDRRVQVVADVVDHHVHVRARKAANELGKGEWSQIAWSDAPEPPAASG